MVQSCAINNSEKDLKKKEKKKRFFSKKKNVKTKIELNFLRKKNFIVKNILVMTIGQVTT